ncbi:MAG: hypothetical protein GY816_18245 [Cytophagales bacterium]|nr:hypothetical protein [Cytophagales bacterium]
MDSLRNVVIVGGEDGNPSRFVTQIGPVKFAKDFEMAITSFYHGEVFNINNTNNKVYFHVASDRNPLSLDIIKKFKGKTTANIPSSMGTFVPVLKMVTIPEGSYSSSISVCWAITNLIKKELGLTRKRDAMNAIMDKQSYNVINIELNNLYMVMEGQNDTPWALLGVHEDKFERFTIENKDLHCCNFPAIAYANIVENSYINGKASRNLGIISIKNGPQWSYEPAHPNYIPINVKEFCKISIELRDIKGQYIKFNPMFNNIMMLSIRPIKGSEGMF